MVTPTDVGTWFDEHLHLEDTALADARERARKGGLPDIAVDAAQGAFLQLLALTADARRVLEVGTLGGYSTIWLARGLRADGRVVSLEIDPHHAEVARTVVDEAGLGGRVDIVVGPAIETLPTLEGPFDLVFVDADKQNNATYVRAALELTPQGALIVVDNVVRDGAVVDPTDDSPTVRGVREVVELVATDPRVELVTAMQTVGPKGWDGLLVVRRGGGT